MSDPQLRQRMVDALAQELDIPAANVRRTLELFDAGNTLPFVARYRKEATGELDEVQLRRLSERSQYWEQLETRKAEVLDRIASQGKLTDSLQQAIEAAETLQVVEDHYLPFRPRRRTRATMARERGLEPVAELMLAGQEPAEPWETWIAEFRVSPQGETLSDEAILAGARDVVAETVAEDSAWRGQLRRYVGEQGELHSAATEANDRSPYAMYFDYTEAVGKVRPHRILAMNRGENEGQLRVRVVADHEPFLERLWAAYVPQSPRWRDDCKMAIEDGYFRLMFPAIERELRRTLTEQAEEHAISVFGTNLSHLLLQAPLKEVRVMGIDPAYRTGCKVAVVDAEGELLMADAIFPHPPQRRAGESRCQLERWLEEYAVDVIAIGNGTAARETESLVAEMLQEREGELQYAIVNEAGASVYSASEIAGRELPELDVSYRGAVSIARRLQDPLAELVKIEPRSIGVGLYQHDVSQTRLAEVLDAVVESAVNRVGVDLNRASPQLLSYVAGLRPALAERIVAARRQQGRFNSRDELLQVAGLGPVTFTQAAGFLRVKDGNEILDDTWVHPESYPSARAIVGRTGFDLGDLRINHPEVQQQLQALRAETLAEELGQGVPTVRDIVDALQRPGRDPRESLSAPLLRSDVQNLADLQAGEILLGTVRNVIDFGAFVDIGVGRDGLVHISEISDRFIQSPHDELAVGDVITVRVLEIDRGRERISLTIKGV